ncbi:hypothetical protein HZC07_04385, partial [Candidatus Micrarchaeota archaeon]|nr:hypothetical protein [Candidatus Micrarchaeota archaeon]
MQISQLCFVIGAISTLFFLFGCLSDADLAKWAGAPPEVVKLAAANQNCTELDDTESQGRCFEQKAEASGNVKYCDEIAGFNEDTRYYKNNCYTNLSLSGEKVYCDRILGDLSGIFNTGRAACLTTVAEKKMDMTLCNQLDNPYIVNDCA